MAVRGDRRPCHLSSVGQVGSTCTPPAPPCDHLTLRMLFSCWSWEMCSLMAEICCSSRGESFTSPGPGTDPGACPGATPVCTKTNAISSKWRGLKMGSISTQSLSLSTPTSSPGCSQGRSLILLPQAGNPTEVGSHSPGNPPPGWVSTSLLFFCAQDSPWGSRKRGERS